MNGRKSHPRSIEWLALRRTAPGVLDGSVLQALATRFQRRSLRSRLLERLLLRLAMFDDARREALIWRMPWEAEGGAMDALPVAQGSATVVHATAPGVMLARERPGKFESTAAQPSAASQAGAVALGRVVPSALVPEHGASISMPMRRLSGAPSTPVPSAETRIRSLAGSRDAVGVSSPTAAATGVTNAKAFASTRVTVERALAKFVARHQDRYGGSPAVPTVSGEMSSTALAKRAESLALAARAVAPSENSVHAAREVAPSAGSAQAARDMGPLEDLALLAPGIAPFANTASARALEHIVLRESAIPSGQREPNEMPARKAEPGSHQSARSMEVTSPDSISTRASSVRTARPDAAVLRAHDDAPPETISMLAEKSPLTLAPHSAKAGAARPFVADERAPSAVEHSLDSPERLPLLLRKAVAVKSSEPRRVTESSHEVTHAVHADARPTPADAAPATQRTPAPLNASHRMDTVQFDALIERLVARLEIEARRQGRYRWRS